MNEISASPRSQFDQVELAQFANAGYVIARGLLPDGLRLQLLDAVQDDLRRHVGPVEYEAEVHYPGAPNSLEANGGRTIRRLKQAHSRHIVFTDWIASPELAARLRQLLGPEVVMPLAHHNCVMTKQPRFSSDTGWHQDIRYWSFEKPELVSIWAALGPERTDNGCLQLIPGTHRIAFDRDRLDAALFLRPELPENAELIERKIFAELEPGDVLFFHCRTIHAATRNYSDGVKLSVVFTFRAADNRPLPGSRSASLPEILLPATG